MKLKKFWSIGGRTGSDPLRSATGNCQYCSINLFIISLRHWHSLLVFVLQAKWINYPLCSFMWVFSYNPTLSLNTSRFSKEVHPSLSKMWNKIYFFLQKESHSNVIPCKTSKYSKVHEHPHHWLKRVRLKLLSDSFCTLHNWLTWLKNISISNVIKSKKG